MPGVESVSGCAAFYNYVSWKVVWSHGVDGGSGEILINMHASYKIHDRTYPKGSIYRENVVPDWSRVV